jgi:hypothetical protein
MMRDQRESKINLSEDFALDMSANGALVEPTLGGDNYIFKPADSMQFRLVDASQTIQLRVEALDANPGSLIEASTM